MVELHFPEAVPERFFLHLTAVDPVLCTEDLGLSVDLRIRADLDAFTRWWLGELPWGAVLRTGAARLDGPTALRRAFPTWFRGYLFAPESAFDPAPAPVTVPLAPATAPPAVPAAAPEPA